MILIGRCMQRPLDFQGKRQFWSISKNDSAKNELQAPIFEDKVVDFIVELAKVTEKEVSLEDLMKLDQPDGNEKKPIDRIKLNNKLE